MFVQVVIAGSLLAPLTYSLPEQWIDVRPGCRVKVPFRQQTKVALVLDCISECDLDANKVKSVAEILDPKPILSSLDLVFLRWIADYYHQPLGLVLKAALPKKIRSGEPIVVTGEPAWQVTELGKQAQVATHATLQAALLHTLTQAEGPLNAIQLNQRLSSWRPAMQRLVAQSWVTKTIQSCLPPLAPAAKPQHRLNSQQQQAIEAVLAVQQAEGFSAFLLQGVTGSGKTETYLGMIEQVIARGQQVLVLIPEIGLTPQTVARFSAYLQQPIAVMHSELSDKERLCAWHLVKTHQVGVLLGTRSALFTPFANLGLCIIDEEHDLSFKQQEGFRYSARDGLVKRAQLAQVPVVLGSATPSLESVYNVALGRYQHLRLTQRATGAVMPDIRLLDVRNQPLQAGLSPDLLQAIEQRLAKKEQVLLFLNRRGFAPVLMCHQCGWQAVCPSCDANMTFHSQRQTLLCHHCGHQASAPHVCPDCGAQEFVPVGQGTEQLETLLTTRFANHKVLRIDRDTTRHKGDMARLTELAQAGQADILVGTQMLAKGHHFPLVTLVGLLDLDQGLFSSDFRAAERMAQLIVQVAGRAGRESLKGEVIIQTHHPEHPLLNQLVKQGYDGFAQQALPMRQQAGLPPFYFSALLRAEAFDESEVWHFLQLAQKNLLKSRKMLKFEKSDLGVFGPVAAPMLRRKGYYRYQLWLVSRKRSYLQQALSHWLPCLVQNKKVRWNLDVDPQEMT